jgi:hypothetical protein
MNQLKAMGRKMNQMVCWIIYWKKYFDIFSMDLPRILPTREVDHTIDLDPNAKPIVKLHIIIPIWKTKNWNK